MKILDGKKMSEVIAQQLRAHIEYFKKMQGLIPCLVIIQVGHQPDSDIYIKKKVQFADRIGARAEVRNFEDKKTTAELIEEVRKLNSDKNVHGLIVQLPLPDHLDEKKILDSVAPEKDVDGLSAENIRRLQTAVGILPATTRGIIDLLIAAETPIAGSHVAIVGNSILVGQPTAQALRNLGAVVNVCDSKTSPTDLLEVTRVADIVVTAVGKAGLITASHLRDGQTVIDVGISIGSDGKIYGDVERAIIDGTGGVTPSAITPVPGGVGPMTVASLFQNLVEAFRGQTVESQTTGS